MKITVSIQFDLYFLFLFLTLSTGISAIHQEYFEIIQIPEGTNIVEGTPLNVTVLFSNYSLIESVHLMYCSIEPVFSCHFPIINLTSSAKGSFSTVFHPEYEEGTIFGYHIYLNFYNGSTILIPNSFNFPKNKTNIRQAEDNQYYFELVMVRESSSKSNQISWPNLYCTVLLLIVVLSSRRIRKL
jgi:hypothetical protein